MQKQHFHRRGRPFKRGAVLRRGTAVSELAITLPILTLLVFGGIETADIIHLKGYLRNISYEGGREAARFNSSTSDVLDRMNALLDATSVEDATVDIELPQGAADVSELERGDLIKITISAPAEANTVSPLKLYSQHAILAEAFVIRE